MVKKQGWEKGLGKHSTPVKLNEGPKLQDAEKGKEIKEVWIDNPKGIISENK